MYAYTREALVTYAATVLHTFVEDFQARDFFAKHIGTHGSVYLDVDKTFEDPWAKAVMDDALTRLEHA